jgi:hypothetical protein
MPRSTTAWSTAWQWRDAHRDTAAVRQGPRQLLRSRPLRLNARLLWVDEHGERELGARQLVVEELLPLARRGLQSRNIPDAEIDEYLNIIGARVESSQNGAAWQRRWVAMHGTDLHALVQAYRNARSRASRCTPGRCEPAAHLRWLPAGPHRLRARAAGPSRRPGADPRAGPSEPPVFVSVLLHGNETSGWEGVRRLLTRRRRCHAAAQPDSVHRQRRAAAAGVRTLPHQQDYNRIWRGAQGPRARWRARCLPSSRGADAVCGGGPAQQHRPEPPLRRGHRSAARQSGARLPVRRQGRVRARAGHGADARLAGRCPAMTLELGPIGDPRCDDRAFDYVGAA